jgi:hypothetical protein
MPKLCGLPKIHKPGNKMRPISSNNNTLPERIAKWLKNKFIQLPNPRGEWVKNTLQFIERVKETTLNEDELLVSFDVTALYPNVPIPAAMKLVKEKHEVVMYSELAELCMSEHCFQFEEKFYRQTSGISMGNALSPFIANLFMGF